jgi:ribonuclease HI
VRRGRAPASPAPASSAAANGSRIADPDGGPAPPVRLVIHADGASRGNPGLAGAGVVVSTPEGRVVEEASRFLGHATNNIAEYRALILGLEVARRLGAAEVAVRMDSELVVRQMEGRYRVRNLGLKPLHAAAADLVRGFRRFTIQHVPRDRNGEADRLANQAIDDRAMLDGDPR